jgi:transposase InsO family protein
MMVDKAAAMAITTFRKYARLLHFNKAPIYKDKIFTSLKASAPFQILQMDVTIFRPIDRSRVYLYILMDNFSRKILGYKCSLSFSPSISLDVLNRVSSQYHLHLLNDIAIVTDDGVEYKSYFDDYIASSANITHFIAQKDIVESNSMIEAVNKRIKYDFLFTKPLPGFEAVCDFLQAAIPAYNSKPLFALSGYTPDEVLNGAIPDTKRFAASIAAACSTRQNENASFACCSI